MNRSTVFTFALCLAFAPLAAGCDGEILDEEGQGEASGEASGDDSSEDDADGDLEDADPSDADIDACLMGEVALCTDTATHACMEDPGVPGHFIWGDCEESGGVGSTPLVLSFDGGEPTMLPGASSAFDLSGQGVFGATDWPAATTPWLALDRDGDGAIGDGAELFGSGVRLASGQLASHGFEALAELDENGDGALDARDPRFGELLVWTDAGGDRLSQGHELTAATQHGLVSIELASRTQPRCDLRGNCGIERAAFTFRGPDGAVRTGEVVDIHLKYQR